MCVPDQINSSLLTVEGALGYGYETDKRKHAGLLEGCIRKLMEKTKTYSNIKLQKYSCTIIIHLAHTLKFNGHTKIYIMATAYEACQALHASPWM